MQVRGVWPERASQVNDGEYDPDEHDVISNASCTTNCVAPMAKVLNDSFGLVHGLMTTIHAYTGDQMLLDGAHKDSMARTRTCAGPGIAVRVPVEDGSLTDLTAIIARPASADEVNEAFRKTSEEGSLARLLRYSTDPLVSREIIGDPASCVFDAPLTQASDALVKVSGWYDNEMGLHLPSRRPDRDRRAPALGILVYRASPARAAQGLRAGLEGRESTVPNSI